MKFHKITLFTLSITMLSLSLVAFAENPGQKIDSLAGNCKVEADRAVRAKLESDAAFRKQIGLEKNRLTNLTLRDIAINVGTPNSFVLSYFHPDTGSDAGCAYSADVQIRPKYVVPGKDPYTEENIREAVACDILSVSVDSNPVDCG